MKDPCTHYQSNLHHLSTKQLFHQEKQCFPVQWITEVHIKIINKRILQSFFQVIFFKYICDNPNEEIFYSCVLPEQYLNIFNDDINQII